MAKFDVSKVYDGYEEKVANQKKKQKALKNATYVPSYSSSVGSPSGFNYETIAKRVAKEKEEEELLKAQQAEIDAQYQSELEKSNQRSGFMGGVDRVFDVLSTGGYVVNGFLQDGFEGAYQGLLGGLDGFTKEERGKEYSFNDTLDKWSGGKWNEYNPDSFLGKAGKFVVNLAGEIATDPLSYLSGAGIAKSIARGTGVRATGLIGRTAMKEVTEDAIINAGKKLVRATGDDLSKNVAETIAQNASRYAQKANKLAGNVVTVGDATFGIGKAKITLKGSGDALRFVGDKTIAPYYNTLQDALKRANIFKPFTNNGQLRKQIVSGNLEDFVKTMHIKDTEIAMRNMRYAVPNEILGTANNSNKIFAGTADKTNQEAQEYMFNILENSKSYDVVEELKELGDEGKEMVDNLIANISESAPGTMKDVTVSRVIEDLKASKNVFAELKEPKDAFKAFVYKRLIDPNNAYDNYSDAYNAFKGRYHINKVVNKVDLEPVQSVAQAVAKKEASNLTPTAMETGLFINKQNTNTLSKLLKENKVISKLVKSPTEAKVDYLNDILFDGRKVVVANEVAETNINNALVAIKNGADEGAILNALQDSIDLSKTHSLDDLFMSTDEIAKFEETLTLPARYDNVKNRVLASGLAPNEGKMRIYNKETGELFYSLNSTTSNVSELMQDVTAHTIDDVANVAEETFQEIAPTKVIPDVLKPNVPLQLSLEDLHAYTDPGYGIWTPMEYIEGAVKEMPKDEELAMTYAILNSAVKRKDMNTITQYLTEYATNKESSDLYKLMKANNKSDIRIFDNMIQEAMPKAVARQQDQLAKSVTRHAKETAVERVTKQEKILTDIKEVVKGEKTIADTGLVETISREKKALVDDYVSSIISNLPPEFQEIAQNDELLERFVKTVFDENGKVNEEVLARYVGKQSEVNYALSKGLPIKDLSKFDNVTYNSLNAMPKVQLSENFSKTPRQLIRDIFGINKKNGELFNELAVDVLSKADLSDDARTVGNMIVNGKIDNFSEMLLNAQLAEDFKQTPVYEFMQAYIKELPQTNKGAGEFRKANAETFMRYLDGLFSGNAKVKYADNVLETKETIKPLFEAYNAKNGKFYSKEVVENLMKLEAELPSEMRTVKDIYTQVITDEDGVVQMITYDPYTMETARQAVSKTIVDNELTYNTFFNKEAEMTKLDYYLNHAYKSDVLDKQFTDFVTSTYNVPKNSQYVIREGVAYAKQVDRRLNLSAYDLSDEMRNTLQYVFEELKRIGMDEHTANKLDNMLNEYVPHIINKEMFKNPNIMKAIQKENPELYRMIFKSAGDKFNPHNVSRSGELEEVVKKILGTKYANEGKVYTGTGKTVQEVNEALKPLLKSAGFDGDFFVNNLYDAFAQRVVTHGDVLYSDKIIDETLELFGTYVRPDLVKPNKTYYLNQKDLRRFFDGTTEDQQYIILQELGIDISKTYNKMLIGVKGDKLDKFYRIAEKWKGKENTLPNFVAYELPEQIAHFAQNKGYTQALDDTNVMLKVIDKFTNLWKQTSTVINPAFHMRNKLSNKFQTFLNVGSDTFNPQVRKMTKEILEGKNGSILLENGQEITYQTIRNELVARDIVSFQNFNRIDNKLADSTASLFSEELKGSGGVMEAIGRMLGKENPSKFNKLDPTDTANFALFEVGRKFGGKIEDYDRTLNFVSRVRHGEDFSTAHEMVNKFMFDYSDLTPFEMNVMKRIVPFYTWLRKNAPLQMEMVLEKPWVYSTIAHAQRESVRGADQEHLPNYMQEWFRLPIQFEDNDVYANVSLPYADLLKDYTNPSEMFGMVNPLIKVPTEILTNRNNYFGAEIYNENDTADEAFGKIGDYMGSSLLGGYNSLYKAGSALVGDDKQAMLEKLTPMVTGITPKVYDAEKAKEDAIYRAIRNMEAKFAKEEGKTTGLTKTFEEYKKTKLEKYGYDTEK